MHSAPLGHFSPLEHPANIHLPLTILYGGWHWHSILLHSTVRQYHSLIERTQLKTQFLTFAEREGIPIKSGRALTLVTTGQVLTNGVHAASRLIPEFHTLVDVSALAGFVVASVSPLTDAHAAADEFILDALFPSWTRSAGATDVGSFRFLATSAVRIACGTARTLTGE